MGRDAQKIADAVPTTAGCVTLTSALRKPDGRLITAIVAAELFRIAKGRLPGRTNPRAHDLCNSLWQLAWFGAQDDQPDRLADAQIDWERHLQKVVEDASYGTNGAPAELREGYEMVRGVLVQHGLQNPPTPRPPGRWGPGLAHALASYCRDRR